MSERQTGLLSELQSGTYTRPVQAARRAYVRALAIEAAEILREAVEIDDADHLDRIVNTAHGVLGQAVMELLRAHMGGP